MLSLQREKIQMSFKPPSSNRYFTVSPSRDSKSGTFVERAPSGHFKISSMSEKVFDSARGAANTKLRQETGKFSQIPSRKK